MVCLRQNVCLAPEVDIALRLAFDPAGSKCPYLGSFQLLLSEEIDARRSLPPYSISYASRAFLSYSEPRSSCEMFATPRTNFFCVTIAPHENQNL
jgi:hypothetical protein